MRNIEEIEGGKVVGSAKIRKNRREEGFYIQDLSVDENQRRRGIATRLLKKIREMITGTISLEVDETNEAAVSLYNQNGFVIEETVNAKNGKNYLRMKNKN
ncbi:MAG: GNAT family N-acetyltransferase [Pseudomonadales bacterium]|nr:GNAT family N-acetyltransferase [Pseudomonadales bacterium]